GDGAAAPIERLRLQRLDEAATVELARHVLAGAPAPTATALDCIVAESNGNPFLVREIARYLRDRQPSNHAGLRLEQVMAERIERLPDVVRQVLELVAVAGHPVPHEVVSRAVA